MRGGQLMFLSHISVLLPLFHLSKKKYIKSKKKKCEPEKPKLHTKVLSWQWPGSFQRQVFESHKTEQQKVCELAGTTCSHPRQAGAGVCWRLETELWPLKLTPIKRCPDLNAGPICCEPVSPHVRCQVCSLRKWHKLIHHT